MVAWFTTFITSGILIILFIGLKMIQRKYRVLLFWPSVRESIEKVLNNRKERLIQSLRNSNNKRFSYIAKTVTYIPRKITRRGGRWIAQKSDKVVRVVKGKQEIENRGEASYYLNDISSARDKFRRR